MTSIDSVGSVDRAATQVKKVLEVQPAEGPSMETLTQRFQAMIAQEPAAVERPDGPNGIAKVLDTNEKLMRHNEELAQHLMTHSNTMSPAELAAAGAEMARTRSISEFRMQAVSSLASGTSKSIQSLLKNS